MNKADSQEIIDVHCHCFAGQEQTDLVSSGLARLRKVGVRHMAVMGLVNTDLRIQDIDKLIPEGFDNLGDPLFYEADDLMRFSCDSDGMLFPMLDTRSLDGDVPGLLQHYIKLGFRGIKGLYLADDGNDLNIASIPDAFGISLQQYQQREWQIFAFAEANDLPVVYHMDANRYGDVMQAILDDFPRLRINFPHFGIGRKAFRKVLDRYANVYTDIAYMAPHIRNNPESYRDFIGHYPDRVCFGSDALLYQPEIVLVYIELVKSLKMPEELEARVLAGNPRRFLGLAQGA
ncbi:MAG: amidohydrolase family protein [Desulfuromonadales bacterium]|nr:amidohydrolase family protein [Desulfuromonadales bacterium]